MRSLALERSRAHTSPDDRDAAGAGADRRGAQRVGRRALIDHRLQRSVPSNPTASPKPSICQGDRLRQAYSRSLTLARRRRSGSSVPRPRRRARRRRPRARAVLRRFAMPPPRDARVTVVVDVPIAAYSGMVPGFVAGAARRTSSRSTSFPWPDGLSGASRAPAARSGSTHKRRPRGGRGPRRVRYDVASINVGSSVAGLRLWRQGQPLSTRPIGRSSATSMPLAPGCGPRKAAPRS